MCFSISLEAILFVFLLLEHFSPLLSRDDAKRGYGESGTCHGVGSKRVCMWFLLIRGSLECSDECWQVYGMVRFSVKYPKGMIQIVVFLFPNWMK